jgi:hypothetical protein
VTTANYQQVLISDYFYWLLWLFMYIYATYCLLTISIFIWFYNLVRIHGIWINEWITECVVLLAYNKIQQKCWCTHQTSLPYIINSKDDMFWPFLSSHLLVHVHRNIPEKLIHLHDFDYMMKNNGFLILLLHCQYVILRTTVRIYKCSNCVL